MMDMIGTIGTDSMMLAGGCNEHDSYDVCAGRTDCRGGRDGGVPRWGGGLIVRGVTHPLHMATSCPFDPL
jgi:hypothetical protein